MARTPRPLDKEGNDLPALLEMGRLHFLLGMNRWAATAAAKRTCGQPVDDNSRRDLLRKFNRHRAEIEKRTRAEAEAEKAAAAEVPIPMQEQPEYLLANVLAGKTYVEKGDILRKILEIGRDNSRAWTHLTIHLAFRNFKLAEWEKKFVYKTLLYVGKIEQERAGIPGNFGSNLPEIEIGDEDEDEEDEPLELEGTEI